MLREDMSSAGFSPWESRDTMLHDAALGRTETIGRKYKLGEESSHRVFDKPNCRAEREKDPRRVFDKVESRAEIGELPRRAFEEVNTNAFSTKPAVLTTAVAEAGLRGSIRERETWARVARDGYGPAGNDPLCTQGDRYGELKETGCRSGESSRPRPVVGYESSQEIAPRACGEYDILIALLRNMYASR